MSEIKQVICMKWGTLYGAEYVNRLYKMVEKNISGQFRFVCLTDDPTSINSNVECYSCPTVDIPEPHCLRGWRKVSLFGASSDLYALEGTWLYLDLDVVVTGTLDGFFSYKPEKTFIVMKNWTQPKKNIGNTSVYRFTVGADAYMLENLLSKQNEILAEYRNSQTYISRNIKDLCFWPDEWCVLFKTHCVPFWPKRLWAEPMFPEKTRVVAFPGVPNPHQAVCGDWPAPTYKKIYKSIRPALWIKKYWLESEL